LHASCEGFQFLCNISISIHHDYSPCLTIHHQLFFNIGNTDTIVSEWDTINILDFLKQGEITIDNPTTAVAVINDEILAVAANRVVVLVHIKKIKYIDRIPFGDNCVGNNNVLLFFPVIMMSLLDATLIIRFEFSELKSGGSNMNWCLYRNNRQLCRYCLC
jgi:hypothetical protein